MNHRAQRNCLSVTGFAPDTDRRVLKNEFIKFGNIEKLYLESSGKFARVFYSEKESCEAAIRELNNTALNWQVKHDPNIYIPKTGPQSDSSSIDAAGMARYNNYYEDDDFTENYNYCNIHGQPLVVLQAECGDLYVNLKDIRKTGFTIFRKDTFDSVLVDRRQIGKEFELHLLSEAKNYILKNKVAVIDEDEILKTIERCKNKLMGEGNFGGGRNNFGAGRSVAQASGSNIIVTADVHRTSSNTNFPVASHTPNQRPPRQLPNNLMPANMQRNESYRSKSTDRGSRNKQNVPNRDNKDFRNNNTRSREMSNGFVDGFDVPKTRKRSEDRSSNASSSFSDSKVGKKSHCESDSSSNKDVRRVLKEEISKLSLETGVTYQMQVVFSEEKENVYWVQKKDDASAVEELLLQINETEQELENINAQPGQLVIAQFEGVWSRGQVTKVNPLIIHFIDYGNSSVVSSVKPLPDAFKKIPTLAARIMVTKKYQLSEGITELNIKVKQQYDDGTYLVDLADVPSSQESKKVSKPLEVENVDEPKQKFYFEIPKPSAELKDGDKVMIVDTENNKFLVRTRECAQKCKELTEYIKNLDKSALALTNVQEGQLVLCSKDGLVGLYRAVVTKVENASIVTVKYIDFPGEEELSIKSLRNVDDYLANQRSCIMLTPEHNSLQDANTGVMEYIADICKSKQKVTVKLSEDDFDLQFDDGTLLSQKLTKLKSPKTEVPVKPTEEKPSTSKHTEQTEIKHQKKADEPSEAKVTYDEMAWINIEEGPHSFMCYNFKDLSEITMISSSEDVIKHLEKITSIEVTDDVPYKPQEFEMCLVTYKGPDDDEASWFRAAVLSIEDGSYEVTFVDFGNQEIVKSADIRKFPSNLKDIPMLGTACELVGIPDTPEVVKYLKELLPEGEQVDVVVKGLNDIKYQIEIPSIYKQLKARGLY